MVCALLRYSESADLKWALSDLSSGMLYLI